MTVPPKSEEVNVISAETDSCSVRDDTPMLRRSERAVVWAVALGLSFLAVGPVQAQETPPTVIEPGSSWVDPDHGHRIFRLTGSGAHHAYNYWAALNADNTLLLGYDSGPTLWDVSFGDTTVAVTNGRPAFSSGVQLHYEGFIWSRTEPSKGFGAYASTSDARLYRYDMRSQTPTLLKDFDQDQRFTSEWGTGAYLWQLQSGHVQERFVASVKDGSGAVVGVVVWDRTTDQVWTYRPPSGEEVDEALIDNQERYVYVLLMGRRSQVLDLETGELSAVLDYSAGHPDMLDGEAVHAGDNGAVGYSLTSPYGTRNIFDWPDRTVAGEEHASTLAGDGWIYSSVYGTDGTRDVIYRVRTDGSDFTILARHFSTASTYSAQPHGAVSYDGGYVVFGSDWGGSQLDIYAVRVGAGEDVPAKVTGVEVRVSN